MSIREAPQPAVLEEAADDRLHVDIFAQARNAGPEAANAPNDEIDLNARRARFVEPVDDRQVDERVHLGPNSGGLAGLGVGDLAVDQLDQLRSHLCWRDDELLEVARLEVAGDVVEQLGSVAAEL